MREHGGYSYGVVVLCSKYSYFILDKDDPDFIKIQSNEWFDSEGRANLAAIGHISLLEQGGNNDQPYKMLV